MTAKNSSVLYQAPDTAEKPVERIDRRIDSVAITGIPEPHVIPDSLEVLGMKVTPFTSYEHACHVVAHVIAKRTQAFCVAINPEKTFLAKRDQRLKSLLNKANMQICDGIGTAIATRVIHGLSLPRITGVDLFIKLLKFAEDHGWSVYLLGATSEVNSDAHRTLTEMYPSLQIAGRRDGYFRDSQEVIEDINASGANLLFVAMGSPQQEYWIAENRDHIQAPFCMGIGGTLDVMSGKIRRAPKFFRYKGLEWLYRLVTQPSRWKRQSILPLYAMDVVREATVRATGFRPRKPR